MLCVCSSETGHVYVTSDAYNCYCGLWIQMASFGVITSEPNKLLCFPVPQHLGEAQTRDDLQSTPNMLAQFLKMKHKPKGLVVEEFCRAHPEHTQHWCTVGLHRPRKSRLLLTRAGVCGLYIMLVSACLTIYSNCDRLARKSK